MAARAEISRARPAYTPPSSGSTSRSVTSSPNRAATRSPTVTSPSTGSTRSSRRPGQSLGGEHPTVGQLVEVERCAHQAARQRTQRAAGPDPGASLGGVDDLEAERTGQVDALGAAVQHRLRADVDDHPADRPAPQLSTDLVGTLEHHDLMPGVGQVPRRGQPGDPGSHDGDPHRASLSGHGSVTTRNARR